MFVDPARTIGNPTSNRNEKQMEEDDDKTINSSNSEPGGKDDREMMVKWCIQGVSDQQKAKTILIKILAIMSTNFYDDISIIDNKAEEFKAEDQYSEAKVYEDMTKGKFQVHQATSKNERQRKRWYCVHKIYSSQSLSTIKAHYEVSKALKENNAYLTIHRFEQKDWDIVHLGFLKGYNVLHLTPAAAKIILRNKALTIDKGCPNFELSNTRIRQAYDSKQYSTTAFEVQCKRSDARQISTILKSGLFRKTTSFVPYSFKKTMPEAFRQAIQAQNKYLANTWVVKIEGFTHQALDECKVALISGPGAQEIIPTKKTNTHGEWKILVEKDNLSFYYDWLRENLEDIINTFARHIPIPDNLPPYKINSRQPMHYQDASEDGSYGTMFSTTMSLNTTGSNKAYNHYEQEPAKQTGIDDSTPTNISYATAASTGTTNLSDITSEKGTDGIKRSQSSSKETETAKKLQTIEETITAKLQDLDIRHQEVWEKIQSDNERLKQENSTLQEQLSMLTTLVQKLVERQDDGEEKRPLKRQNKNPTPTKESRRPHDMIGQGRPEAPHADGDRQTHENDEL